MNKNNGLQIKIPAVFDNSGAAFSDCMKYRFALWRIWDDKKPLVMFIGLNPSTANQFKDDPTIESVTRIAAFNGYGGFYMMNCFPYVSTNPDDLKDLSGITLNIHWLRKIEIRCKDVVFAWGSFKVVSEMKMDVQMQLLFPEAKCIVKNKNGTPGHPLFKKGNTQLLKF